MIETYIVIAVFIILLMAVFSPTRWLLLELWTEILKPFILKLLPRIVHWLGEAHLIFIKNLFPRSVVIKTLDVKYQSKDRK